MHGGEGSSSRMAVHRHVYSSPVHELAHSKLVGFLRTSPLRSPVLEPHLHGERHSLHFKRSHWKFSYAKESVAKKTATRVPIPRITAIHPGLQRHAKNRAKDSPAPSPQSG